MGKLPNFEKAVIPIEKLEEYVLNPDHPDGQHKARVFKGCLGIERRHAVAFGEIIRRGLERAPAQFAESTKWGTVGRLCTRSSGYKARPWLSRLVGYLKERNRPFRP